MLHMAFLTFQLKNLMAFSDIECPGTSRSVMIIFPVQGFSLRSRQNGPNFADDIFKGIFLNENIWIPIKISLKFVPKGPINHIPALVQIMAWRRSGDKPLSEPMVISLLMHICVTRPQWVKIRQSWIFMTGIPTLGKHFILKCSPGWCHKTTLTGYHELSEKEIKAFKSQYYNFLIYHGGILLVTPCLLTRIQEFIHTQHCNTMHGRRPSMLLRC